MPKCRKCGVSLTAKNWYPNFKKRNERICRSCKAAYSRTWQKANPNWWKTPQVKRHRREYIRAYMLGYWKLHPEKRQKYAKVARARRRRDYPTTIILNQAFEGAHLHHMTPVIAVYIPEGLHKSVRHNLRTSKGMKEINARVLAWAKGFYSHMAKGLPI